MARLRPIVKETKYHAEYIALAEKVDAAIKACPITDTERMMALDWAWHRLFIDWYTEAKIPKYVLLDKPDWARYAQGIQGYSIHSVIRRLCIASNIKYRYRAWAIQPRRVHPAGHFPWREYTTTLTDEQLTWLIDGNQVTVVK